MISIELARRLEQHGLNGQLVLIDGAPELMRAMIDNFLPSSTEEELQNNVLLGIMDILQPTASAKVNFIINQLKCIRLCPNFQIICFIQIS